MPPSPTSISLSFPSSSSSPPLPSISPFLGIPSTSPPSVSPFIALPLPSSSPSSSSPSPTPTPTQTPTPSPSPLHFTSTADRVVYGVVVSLFLVFCCVLFWLSCRRDQRRQRRHHRLHSPTLLDLERAYGPQPWRVRRRPSQSSSLQQQSIPLQALTRPQPIHLQPPSSHRPQPQPQPQPLSSHPPRQPPPSRLPLPLTRPLGFARPLPPSTPPPPAPPKSAHLKRSHFYPFRARQQQKQQQQQQQTSPSQTQAKTPSPSQTPLPPSPTPSPASAVFHNIPLGTATLVSPPRAARPQSSTVLFETI